MQVLPTVSERARRLRVAVAVVLGICVVAVAGMTLTDLGPWYQGLQQPGWKPPDAWFGPAWMLIYGCVAVATVRAWLGAEHRAQRRWLLVALGMNAALNILWSALFFRLRRPDLALIEVVFFWLSILALLLVTRRSDDVAPWLLVPYLVWVGYAAAINLAVVRLNASF